MVEKGESTLPAVIFLKAINGSIPPPTPPPPPATRTGRGKGKLTCSFAFLNPYKERVLIDFLAKEIIGFEASQKIRPAVTS